MDHYSIDVYYDNQEDRHYLKVNPLSPIPGDIKSERQTRPFIIDSHPELAWLKGFRVDGYPDVIRVPFRMPPFQLEYVPTRIEWYKKGRFKCRVLCEPKMECNIHKGDCIEVVHFIFEKMHHLHCKTIEERNGFEWA